MFSRYWYISGSVYRISQSFIASMRMIKNSLIRHGPAYLNINIDLNLLSYVDNFFYSFYIFFPCLADRELSANTYLPKFLNQSISSSSSLQFGTDKECLIGLAFSKASRFKVLSALA